MEFKKNFVEKLMYFWALYEVIVFQIVLWGYTLCLTGEREYFPYLIVRQCINWPFSVLFCFVLFFGEEDWPRANIHCQSSFCLRKIVTELTSVPVFLYFLHVAHCPSMADKRCRSTPRIWTHRPRPPKHSALNLTTMPWGWPPSSFWFQLTHLTMSSSSRILHQLPFVLRKNFKLYDRCEGPSMCASCFPLQPHLHLQSWSRASPTDLHCIQHSSMMTTSPLYCPCWLTHSPHQILWRHKKCLLVVYSQSQACHPVRVNTQKPSNGW